MKMPRGPEAVKISFTAEAWIHKLFASGCFVLEPFLFEEVDASTANLV